MKLSTIALRVARLVTEPLDGEATGGDANTITDTLNIVQPNEYWDRGTAWILSGTYAGSVRVISSHSGNSVDLETALAGAIVATNRYALVRSFYPWQVLRRVVNDALSEVRVIVEESSLEGDGETLEFTLNATVTGPVRRVHFVDPARPTQQLPSSHFRQVGNKLRFDYGYAPVDGYAIKVGYEDDHPALSSPDDAVDPSVNTIWLQWKAAEYALYWAAKTYPNAQDLNVEILMNRVIGNLKGLYPTTPQFRVHTAGG